jgi:hypothetical protein
MVIRTGGPFDYRSEGGIDPRGLASPALELIALGRFWRDDVGCRMFACPRCPLAAQVPEDDSLLAELLEDHAESPRHRAYALVDRDANRAIYADGG